MLSLAPAVLKSSLSVTICDATVGAAAMAGKQIRKLPAS